MQRAEVDDGEHRVIWDLPLRLCHWLLVIAIPAAYVTAQLGGVWADWHGRIGGFVLALLVFRLVWGFIGTTHARFASFLPTPASIRRYWQGAWHGAGHNPLGALAVVAMLLAMLVQVVTGLFANDDIAFQGPLAGWVPKSTSDALTALHHQSFNVLLGLIALHVAAIAFYALVKRSNLILPMITGKKVVRPVQSEVERRLRLRHVVAATVVSGVCVWGIFSSAIEPVPAAAEPASLPAW